VLPPLHPDPSSSQDPSFRNFVWMGEGHDVCFRVGCLASAAPGRFQCEARVIEGRNVKLLTFDIEVAGTDSAVPRALDGNGDVNLNAVVVEERGNVAEIPYEELVFVKELGGGVQVR